MHPLVKTPFPSYLPWVFNALNSIQASQSVLSLGKNSQDTHIFPGTSYLLEKLVGGKPRLFTDYSKYSGNQKSLYLKNKSWEIRKFLLLGN